MVFSGNDYVVAYTGLKTGKHHFQYQLGETFFKAFDYSLIEKAAIDVKVILDKMSSMMTFHIEFEGTIQKECDLCLEALEVPIKGNNRLIVKFGDELFEETEEIVVLPHSEHKINLAQYLYEFVHLALPSRSVHPDGLCNPDMIKRLQDETNEEEDIDPRWKALEGLK